MEQFDLRQQGGLPNWLVYCDSFLWLGWHANPWVSDEWWLKQSSWPSAFQLWYITFCPPVTHFESMDQRTESGERDFNQWKEGSLKSSSCNLTKCSSKCHWIHYFGLFGDHLSLSICINRKWNKIYFWTCHLLSISLMLDCYNSYKGRV